MGHGGGGYRNRSTAVSTGCSGPKGSSVRDDIDYGDGSADREAADQLVRFLGSEFPGLWPRLSSVTRRTRQSFPVVKIQWGFPISDESYRLIQYGVPEYIWRGCHIVGTIKTKYRGRCYRVAKI